MDTCGSDDETEVNLLPALSDAEGPTQTYMEVALSDTCPSALDWEMTSAHREPGDDGRNWPGSGGLSLRLAGGGGFTNLALRVST